MRHTIFANITFLLDILDELPRRANLPQMDARLQYSRELSFHGYIIAISDLIFGSCYLLRMRTNATSIHVLSLVPQMKLPAHQAQP